MRNLRKLYLLSTVGLKDFYVVSTSSTEAEQKLKQMLDQESYGYSSDRKIKNIQILSEELYDFPEGKPNFSSGNNLIII